MSDDLALSLGASSARPNEFKALPPAVADFGTVGTPNSQNSANPSQRIAAASLPATRASTSAREVMALSPGVVMASAPWAVP